VTIDEWEAANRGMILHIAVGYQCFALCGRACTFDELVGCHDDPVICAACDARMLARWEPDNATLDRWVARAAAGAAECSGHDDESRDERRRRGFPLIDDPRLDAHRHLRRARKRLRARLSLLPF